MPSTDPEYVAVGHLADQAAHAIRLLNHRTRPATGGLADPADAAEIITALAGMAGKLPQLLGQLAHWLEHEHTAPGCVSTPSRRYPIPHKRCTP